MRELFRETAIKTIPDSLPTLALLMDCSRCGIIGAYARPNWKEKPERESLRGAPPVELVFLSANLRGAEAKVGTATVGPAAAQSAPCLALKPALRQKSSSGLGAYLRLGQTS
jgi:hypothetical protein